MFVEIFNPTQFPVISTELNNIYNTNKKQTQDHAKNYKSIDLNEIINYISFNN